MNRSRDLGFGPLAAQDSQPAFDEPWQAKIMVLAFASCQSGLFSSAQWSEALGKELTKNEQARVADERTGYYQAALRTLETLLLATSELTQESVTRRQTEWRRAFLKTPHGMPVELGAGGQN